MVPNLRPLSISPPNPYTAKISDRNGDDSWPPPLVIDAFDPETTRGEKKLKRPFATGDTPVDIRATSDPGLGHQRLNANVAARLLSFGYEIPFVDH